MKTIYNLTQIVKTKKKQKNDLNVGYVWKSFDFQNLFSDVRNILWTYYRKNLNSYITTKLYRHLKSPKSRLLHDQHHTPAHFYSLDDDKRL